MKPIIRWTASCAVSAGLLVTVALTAAGDDARYSKPLSWKKDRISRVFALGYTDLGVNGEPTAAPLFFLAALAALSLALGPLAIAAAVKVGLE